MKHLVSAFDLTVNEVWDILSLAGRLKREKEVGVPHRLLEGKVLGMIFAKSSTRTRVSFETGMVQLGGHAIFLNSNDIQLGRGESIADTARVLSRYVDGIMIRTFSHQDVVDLAAYGTLPVINGLTDLMHPCQALADIFTLEEIFGRLDGLKLAYVGDGNNVAHSLLHVCAKLGIHVSVASPEGYACDPEMVAQARQDAEKSGAHIHITTDPAEAVTDARAVYTDTWVSMGQEADKAERVRIFEPYRVDAKLFSLAAPDAVFLHCLPAYRGYEVTEEVMDGSRSVVFQEAENRLHVQKAIMT
ncbi:MAG TPA: ornithine carbamoyltransferase, partial [Clostridiales bacterium]|nr:ornithine carbamoyltransferase [Clostridiales bacterium]